jgi:hypothetical protein
LKRIVLGIMFMMMVLAVYSSTTIVKVNSATGASMVISPDTTTFPNSTFTLNLAINNVKGMRAWDLTFRYSKIISLNSVDTINNTDFTDGDGLAIIKTNGDYNSSCYECDIARTTINIVLTSGTGSGVVAQLHFTAASTGTVTFECISVEIMDPNMNEITPITVTFPTITVATAQPSTPKTVGGWSFSDVKAGSVSDIGLAALAAIVIIAVFAVIIATTIYFRGIKRRKEKQ